MTDDGGCRPELPSRELAMQQAQWLASARSRLLRRVGIARRDCILDLGAGWGDVTKELARRCRGRVVAADTDVSPLSSRRDGHAAVTAIACTAPYLPFRDGVFDLVFCHCALMWMPLLPTLSEIQRILTCNGVLVAVEPDYGGMMEFPADIAVGPVWLAALRRVGADPEVGRKLPAALQGLGMDVEVRLLDSMTPPSPLRFDLLAELPLTDDERRRVEQARAAELELALPWTTLAHLPFMLVTALR